MQVECEWPGRLVRTRYTGLRGLGHAPSLIVYICIVVLADIVKEQ
jgi:hypothetical protein